MGFSMGNKIYEKNITCRVKIANGEIFLTHDYKQLEFNHSAYEIWKCIDGNTTVEQIIDKIAQKYGVDISIVRDDIFALLQDWEQQKLIDIVDC
jgi:hypothetical protein